MARWVSHLLFAEDLVRMQAFSGDEVDAVPVPRPCAADKPACQAEPPNSRKIPCVGASWVLRGFDAFSYLIFSKVYEVGIVC